MPQFKLQSEFLSDAQLFIPWLLKYRRRSTQLVTNATRLQGIIYIFYRWGLLFQGENPIGVLQLPLLRVNI